MPMTYQLMQVADSHIATLYEWDRRTLLDSR